MRVKVLQLVAVLVVLWTGRLVPVLLQVIILAF